jgi:hypothetical protein
MNANRALGLLAAILITAGQATLFAVDTSSSAQSQAQRDRYELRLQADNAAARQLAPSASVAVAGG